MGVLNIFPLLMLAMLVTCDYMTIILILQRKLECQKLACRPEWILKRWSVRVDLSPKAQAKSVVK